MPPPPHLAAWKAGFCEFWSLLKQALRGTAQNLGRAWPWYLGLFALAVAIAWLVLQPHDDDWMKILRGGAKPNSSTRTLAQWIGSTGDELQFNLSVFAVLWFLFGRRQRHFWRRVAVASLVGMVFAGLICNLLRPTFGRPRPSTQSKKAVPDGMYWGRGFTGGHAYQSFPSAHTATAFGTATAIFVAHPLVGAPVMLYAGGMAWARTAQNAHHPSDVFAGAALGLLAGCAAGRWARQSSAPSTTPIA